MDKLKKILRHDDDVLYKDGANVAPGTVGEEHAEGGLSGGAPSTLQTKSGTEEQDSGILRQIANPEGAKHDDLAYGSTATVQSGSSTGASGIPSSTAGTLGTGDNAEYLQTKPEAEKKDHGILRQIMDPSGNKYDDVAHGQTATVGGASSELPTRSAGTSALPSSSMTTGTPIGQPLRPQLSAENASTASIKSGVRGPYADDQADTTSATGATNDSHLGRDTALGGAGAAGVASAVMGAEKHHSNTGNENVAPSSTGERAFPLSGGATTGSTTQSSSNPLTSGISSSGLGHGSSLTHPSSTSTTTAPGGNSIPAIAGWAGHDHEHQPHGFAGDPCGPGEESPVPGYVHHAKGPHSTDIANRLDPHVPGEFPSESGLDRHAPGGAASALAPGSTAGSGILGGGLGSSSNKFDDTVPSNAPVSSALSTAPIRSSEPEAAGISGSHHGRDAALAGGAGAAGLGAYEATKHHGELSSSGLTGGQTAPSSSLGGQSAFPSSSQPLASSGLSGTSSGPLSGSSTTQPQSSGLGSSSSPLGSSSTTQPQSSDHHYGRDAALAGGAGAAGLGAYEATRDHNTPSSTSTGGPLSSHSPTSGSGVLPTGGSSQRTNIDSIADAPLSGSQQTQPEHHYGRDAGIAGGAGALGLGAYEATKNRDAPTSSSTGGLSSHAPTTQSSNIGATTSSTLPSSSTRQPEHHYGRDAGLAGGAGAAGIGAYEANKHHDSTHTPVGNTPLTQASPATQASATGPAYESTQPKEHHYGRDAAAVGGAGAAGYAVHEGLDDKKAEKLEKKHEKEIEKEEKHHAKDEKKREKEAEKEGKKYMKESEHEHNKLHKDAPEEKKPSLIHRILHPGEKKHEGAAVAGTAGAAGATEGRRSTSDRPYGLELKEADEARHAEHQRKLERDGVLAGTGVAGLGAAGAAAAHHGSSSTSTAHEQPGTIFNTSAGEHNTPSHGSGAVGTAGAAGLAGTAAGHHGPQAGVVTTDVPKAPLSEVQRNADHELNIPPPSTEPHVTHQPGVVTGDVPKAPLSEVQHNADRELNIPPPSTEPHVTHQPGVVTGDVPKAPLSEVQRNADHELNLPGHSSHGLGAGSAAGAGTAAGLGSSSGLGHSSGLGSSTGTGSSGIVTEPHTGLPMNVGKYGDGHGGTDGSSTVRGFESEGGAGSTGTGLGSTTGVGSSGTGVGSSSTGLGSGSTTHQPLAGETAPHSAHHGSAAGSGSMGL
ncbi:hypothetical protein B0A48_09916 [Cryoendolithus antarcticus]|uniref:Dehydrin-like protein 3 n=1 Tax=Cryoendolithus antarcticus TaxID=1507870 RepID=A0A1V8T3I5_9PEZI|nr:hypothetical protein B0A48_09916 [Cryoendolithus antarcticus]